MLPALTVHAMPEIDSREWCTQTLMIAIIYITNVLTRYFQTYWYPALMRWRESRDGNAQTRPTYR